MTQRQEARFKVYTKSSSFLRVNNVFPLELIDFIEGDGTYDTSSYKYSVQDAGTYLLGISYNKREFRYDSGAVRMIIQRDIDGVNTSIVINFSNENETGSYLSMNACTMYKLEVGDQVYCNSPYGRPLTNLNTYTTDDTLNSFWGIKLNY